MSGIDKFLGVNRHADTVKKFNKLSKGKSKEEVRSMEQQMFKPEPLPDFFGEESRFVIHGDYTLKMVIPNEETWNLIGRHFTITNFVEKSIAKIDMLVDFLKLLDSGEVTYDKKTRRFNFSKVGTYSRLRRRGK